MNRFRLHGFTLEQAVMMAEAIEFALWSPDFTARVGTFGRRNLEDAVQAMPL